MSNSSLSRLRKEYEAIQKDPIPNAVAVPDPKNWLRWHYVIYGLDSCFTSGVYYGELRFPANYPMGPPSIIMHTPNGRFIPDKKICTSMSDFHPESWSPIWKVSTIITGLISFMQENERSAGCEVTSNSYKMSLAVKSMDWNNKNSTFKEIFEDYYDLFVQKTITPQVVQQKDTIHGYKAVLIILSIAIFAYLLKVGVFTKN